MTDLIRQIFRFIKEAVERFFFKPSGCQPLAFLRITLGLMMMLELLRVYPSLDELYGAHSFLQVGLMDAVFGRTAPSFAGFFEGFGISYGFVLRFILSLRWVFLTGFVLGFRTRLCTFMVWLTQVFFIYSGAFSSYGVDRYFHLILFLMLWMPIGEAWSLDARKSLPKPSSQARFSLRFLQLSVLITYLDAGASKAQGQEWWNGEAIWRSLHLPDFHQFDFYWMASYPRIPQTLGIGTMILEAFYCVAVWIPGLSTLWITAIIFLHLGIALFMGLVNFGVTLALINVGLFLLPKLFREKKAPTFQPES